MDSQPRLSSNDGPWARNVSEISRQHRGWLGLGGWTLFGIGAAVGLTLLVSLGVVRLILGPARKGNPPLEAEIAAESTDEPSADANSGVKKSRPVRRRYPSGGLWWKISGYRDRRGQWLRHGESTEYFDKGSMRVRGMWRNGKRTGTWTAWRSQRQVLG